MNCFGVGCKNRFDRAKPRAIPRNKDHGRQASVSLCNARHSATQVTSESVPTLMAKAPLPPVVPQTTTRSIPRNKDHDHRASASLSDACHSATQGASESATALMVKASLPPVVPKASPGTKWSRGLLKNIRAQFQSCRKTRGHGEPRPTVPGLNDDKADVEEADKRVTISEVLQRKRIQALQAEVIALHSRWQSSLEEVRGQKILLEGRDLYVSQLNFELQQSRNRENQLRGLLLEVQAEIERQFQEKRPVYKVNQNVLVVVYSTGSISTTFSWDSSSVQNEEPSWKIPPPDVLRDFYCEFKDCRSSCPPPGFEDMRSLHRPAICEQGPAISGPKWIEAHAPAGAYSGIGLSTPWESTNREHHDISISTRLLQDYMRERDADIRPCFQQPQQVPVQGQMIGSRPLDDEEENVRMAHELSMQFNMDTLLADEEVSQIMMNSHKKNAGLEPPAHPMYAKKNPCTGEVGQNHNGSSGEGVNAPVPVAPTAVADVDAEDWRTQLNNSSLNTSGNTFETPNENRNASSASSTTGSAKLSVGSFPGGMYSEFQFCGSNRPPPGFEGTRPTQRPIVFAPCPAPSGQNWNGALGPAGAHSRIGPSNPWQPTNREQDDFSTRLLQDQMREGDADIRPYFQQPQQVPVQGQMIGSRPLDDEEENVRMAHELSMQFNMDTLLAEEEVSRIMMNSHKKNAGLEPPAHPMYAQKNPCTGEVGQNHNGSSGERVNAPVPVAPTAVADVDVEDWTTQLNNSSLNTSGNIFETPNENLKASSASSTAYSALSEESPRHEEHALHVSWSTVARRANNKPLQLTIDNTANKNMKNSEPKIKIEAKGTGEVGSGRKKRSHKPAGGYKYFPCPGEDLKTFEMFAVYEKNTKRFSRMIQAFEKSIRKLHKQIQLKPVTEGTKHYKVLCAAHEIAKMLEDQELPEFTSLMADYVHQMQSIQAQSQKLDKWFVDNIDIVNETKEAFKRVTRVFQGIPDIPEDSSNDS